MAIFEIALLLLAGVLISSVVGQLIPKVSSPLIQIGLGVVLYFIVRADISIHFDSDLFMVLFIAPLLYNEASISKRASLLRNGRVILSLAIGLVVFIMLIVGFSLNWIAPSIPLAAAFALGAALGPTDAVAVTSLPGNVSLGNRIESILQGESLLNDASGIVSFQFAIAAVATGTYEAAYATENFFITFFGGILIGLVIGFIGFFVLKNVRRMGLENITFHVLFDLFLPFIVYFAAELLGSSGILAVVCAGLVKANTKIHTSPNISKLNIVSTSVWKVYVFTLNGIVFILLGALLPGAMLGSWEDPSIDNFVLLFYCLFTTICMYLVRFLWINFIEYFHNRKKNLKLFSRPNMHTSAIMTFAGAKGAVTMSIMFTIPIIQDNGVEFPGRSTLIFIAAGVVLLSLIACNIILPRLMPKSEKIKQKNNEALMQDTNMVSIEIIRQVMRDLTARKTAKNRAATQIVVRSYAKRIEGIKKMNDIDDELNIDLRLKACLWEKEYVTRQLNNNKVEPHIAFKYLKNIDKREKLLQGNYSVIWRIKSFINRVKAYIKVLPKRTKNTLNKETRLPGETVQFNTSDISKTGQYITSTIDLQHATLSHVIKILNDQMNNSSESSEDVANVLTDYRNLLISTAKKSPSLTTIQNVRKDVKEIQSVGFDLERYYIEEKYRTKEITYDQYNKLNYKVLLMEVAEKDF